MYFYKIEYLCLTCTKVAIKVLISVKIAGFWQ